MFMGGKFCSIVWISESCSILLLFYSYSNVKVMVVCRLFHVVRLLNWFYSLLTVVVAMLFELMLFFVLFFVVDILLPQIPVPKNILLYNCIDRHF